MSGSSANQFGDQVRDSLSPRKNVSQSEKKNCPLRNVDSTTSNGVTEVEQNASTVSIEKSSAAINTWSRTLSKKPCASGSRSFSPIVFHSVL